MKAFNFCKEKAKPENEPQNSLGLKVPATPAQKEHTNLYKSNDSTMKILSKITLRKLKKQQILMQKEKLTKNQSSLLIIFLELTTKWNVSLTRRYLQH